MVRAVLVSGIRQTCSSLLTRNQDAMKEAKVSSLPSSTEPVRVAQVSSLISGCCNRFRNEIKAKVSIRDASHA
jgi:hypothetical protein